MGGGVQLLHVDLLPGETDGIHPAADVHAHHVGDGLVADGHGGADGAALAGVYVGHDADAAALGERIVAHAADLLDGLVFDDTGEANGSIDLSLDFHHG